MWNVDMFRKVKCRRREEIDLTYSATHCVAMANAYSQQYQSLVLRLLYCPGHWRLWPSFTRLQRRVAPRNAVTAQAPTCLVTRSLPTHKYMLEWGVVPYTGRVDKLWPSKSVQLCGLDLYQRLQGSSTLRRMNAGCARPPNGCNIYPCVVRCK